MGWFSLPTTSSPVHFPGDMPAWAIWKKLPPSRVKKTRLPRGNSSPFGYAWRGFFLWPLPHERWQCLHLWTFSTSDSSEPFGSRNVTMCAIFLWFVGGGMFWMMHLSKPSLLWDERYSIIVKHLYFSRAWLRGDPNLCFSPVSLDPLTSV